MAQRTLVELMATNPEGTLEDIAKRYQVSLFDVIQVMSGTTIVSGQHFDQIWDEITTWGEITLLVNTADIIFEYHGQLPSGFHRHGYFNLRGKNNLSGHIKTEHCQHIAFIERPFMGMDTASILFLNKVGEAMFKIFVGRDAHRQLQADQLVAYHQLAIHFKTKVKQ
ncbi:MAG: heme utilization cystosolic carrier protein HutX [Candidatus Schmidhempelia sp.]|nr:heme utilization cystosolic carrier protein HutX [Candidatus Schmidhempelia sp.]